MENAISVVESQDVMPICPHCEKALRTVNSRKIKGGMGVRFIYFCGGCKKVLGVSHRKGFWMG